MIFSFEDFALDTKRHELRRGTERVAIEPQVFDILVYLIRNKDRVVNKDDLIGSVWGGRIVSESTLSSRITAVRHAIGDDAGAQRLLRTVPRKGVRFIGDVRETAAGNGTAPQSALAFPDGPSIAVLPFNNLSGDPE